jgi:hypothetical protein
MASLDIMQKLFAAMFTDNPNEQAVACAKFVSACRERSWHPSEIKLLCGGNLLERQHRAIEDLTARNEALEKEVAFYRRRATPQDRKNFRAHMASPSSWKLFSGLVAERLYCTSKLPRGWRQRVAEFLNRSVAELEQWEKNVSVPEVVLDQLRAQTSPLPPLQYKPRKRKASDACRQRASRQSASSSPATAGTESPQSAFVV